MATLPVIEAIVSKVEKVIARNEALSAENGKLSKTNSKLKEQNQDLTQQVAQLSERVRLLELSQGFQAGGVDNKQAQARVNHLMREVDKCIAMLNGQ